jgi:hypothetical protein
MFRLCLMLLHMALLYSFGELDNCVPKNWCSWIQDGFLVLSNIMLGTLKNIQKISLLVPAYQSCLHAGLLVSCTQFPNSRSSRGIISCPSSCIVAQSPLLELSSPPCMSRDLLLQKPQIGAGEHQKVPPPIR